ncbi:MAG: hypothetical protein AB7I68_13620 [Porticoccaceae bacterium]
MRLFICGCGAVLFTFAWQLHAQGVTKIATDGETKIAGIVDGREVVVKIWTREVEIDRRRTNDSNRLGLSCTNGRIPCSKVDRLTITVDGNSIFIPISLFCNLADINTAEIVRHEEEFKLTLVGGDASETYVVNIEFNSDHINRRTFASAIAPDEPLEESIYHVVTVGD